MKNLLRVRNQVVAKINTRFPALANNLVNLLSFSESKGIPWSPVKKPLYDSKVALVTTSGVHHKDQEPFNMIDQNGDPTYRVIDSTRPVHDLMITHDYYDHKDADKDINIVFPIQRLKEFAKEGVIAEAAGTHYSFMGHIIGPHITSLKNIYSPDVSARLKKDGVDIVLLTPG